MSLKKILIISHNVFSKTESMGKTLSSYFNGFNPDSLAQFYIHSQIPTVSICKNYFQITDKDALKSLFGIRVGKIYDEKSIDLSKDESRTDFGVTAKIYQKGRARTPLIYFARNLIWKLSRWNNRKLKKWLDEFNPDCVFFASGDYSFIYDIALSIAKSRSIPLYVSCMDDYYFHNKNENKLFGNLQHLLFMRSVKKAMNYANAIFCICDKMKTDYSSLFHKNCYTIHTCTSLKSIDAKIEKKRQICYFGNLGYKRNEQLIAIGKTLKSLNLDVNHIDVYSSEPRKIILDEMTEKNGIVFHGKICAEEVSQKMQESLAVIHTESFDNNTRKEVRYSVSTKIADSLSCGSLIFAYGPEEVASISYLKEHSAAICCFAEDDLARTLRIVLTDDSTRAKIIDNALTLSKQNHAESVTPNEIKSVLGYIG